MKKLLLTLAAATLLSFSTASAAEDTAPKSVIHVVTVSWKAEATPEQIQAALDGVKALPSSYKGITRVWTKTLKAQGDRKAAIVMEFKDEKALADYAGSDAQKAWYKSYQAARGGSTTFDITN
ncbi:Dabb family protein [Oleiharenicola lentus]|uniref:Dabb family protein n=1 Tax=Oleiharenicola lentus TaxID=2508720 RepID=UPI003F6765A5